MVYFLMKKRTPLGRGQWVFGVDLDQTSATQFSACLPQIVPQARRLAKGGDLFL
jgi:hypothetical protein